MTTTTDNDRRTYWPRDTIVAVLTQADALRTLAEWARGLSDTFADHTTPSNLAETIRRADTIQRAADETQNAGLRMLMMDPDLSMYVACVAHTIDTPPLPTYIGSIAHGIELDDNRRTHTYSLHS